jgi:hypothetical protein
MSARYWLLSLALLAFSARAQPLSAQASSAANSALGSVGTLWGGEHLALEVTTAGASLDFDCATGTMSGALVPDAQGKFMVRGALIREPPGPTMRGENSAAPARFTGRIQGDTLRLVVSVDGFNEPYGEYVLTRGKTARVVKCR